MRIIVMVITYLFGKPRQIEYTEKRVDSLLQTEPREDRVIEKIDADTGEVRLRISRIGHE